jgi:hypothetical protein
MRRLVWIAIPLALLASAPAFAQGTPEQRAACNDDAFKFCDDDVPDAIAVEKCLRAHMSSLSAKCRQEFGGGPSGKGKKARRAPRE